MKKLLLLKTAKENYFVVIDLLKMLVGNHLNIISEEDGLLLEIDSVTSFEVDATLKSLESDLNILLQSYLTSTKNPYEEIHLVKAAFLEADYGHYEFKDLLVHIKSTSNTLAIFNFIVEGTGVGREVVLAMADSNMNVSKAASMLFMHRNTVLYKIERLLELKGFDLKCFNDLYLLVRLLKA